MQAMVVYSSKTGNTQKIATAIFAAIPGESKDLQRAGEYTGKDADIFFVGFWTDKGDCNTEAANFLSGLHGRKIALFGTCGAGKNDIYYDQIIRQARSWIAPDNVYLGAFMCQGKMPIQVRKRFETMQAAGNVDPNLKAMIRNFDEALLHPDRADLEEAAEFSRRMMAAGAEGLADVQN